MTAATWAGSAKPGDGIVIGGPRGSMIIPADDPWHVLAGDAAALPAMRRRLEELPAGSRAIVIAQADAADRLPFHSAANVSVTWAPAKPR
jgi:NADPH-dependent ferric siderophore reductase